MASSEEDVDEGGFERQHLLESSTSQIKTQHKLNTSRFSLALYSSLFVNAVLMICTVSLIGSISGHQRHDPFTLTYSPAQEAVQYETKTFTAGFGKQSSMYMHNGSEPTDELDDLWDDLWNGWGFVGIPKEQAAQLTNMTAPIPGSDDLYIVGLDVFHQLHCLDNLRKALWPERYDRIEKEHGVEVEEHRSPRHLDHCVDSLRQSIMCSSDISTLFFEWSTKLHENLVVAKTTHTCRNFDMIKDWAKERRVHGWDPKKWVPSDLRPDVEFA